MLEPCKRPRSSVVQCFAALIALAAGWALYALAGQMFARWVVDKKLPEIEAQTKEMWKTPTPFVTNFDAAAFRQGLYNPTGALHAADGRTGGSSELESDGDSVEQPANLDSE